MKKSELIEHMFATKAIEAGNKIQEFTSNAANARMLKRSVEWYLKDALAAESVLELIHNIRADIQDITERTVDAEALSEEMVLDITTQVAKEYRRNIEERVLGQGAWSETSTSMAANLAHLCELDAKRLVYKLLGEILAVAGG
jgi:hypothetical protein